MLAATSVPNPALTSRFDTLPRGAARAILLLIVALMVYGFVISQRPKGPEAPMPPAYRYDIVLYKAVAARVGKGENYYQVVTSEQRWRGIPLRPFVTVRPPLLATVTGAVRPVAMAWILRVLAVLTVAALVIRFETALGPRGPRYAALGMAAAAIFMFMPDDMAMLHDVWASLLITLSLAVHRPQCWGLSLCLGLVAVLTRELALPYLLVMALAAQTERRRQEAAGWAGGIMVVFAALALHAHWLAPLVRPTDMHSPGWVSAGGWPFILAMAQLGTLFRWLPDGVSALLLPLAFVGWIGWRHGFALRVALWLGGMATAFMLVGRSDNFYWVLHIAFLLPLGLVFAPVSIKSLVKAASRDKMPIRRTGVGVAETIC
jgi:hypothetical protein